MECYASILEVGVAWPEGKDHDHLYGRPLVFIRQLPKSQPRSGVVAPEGTDAGFAMRSTLDLSREITN